MTLIHPVIKILSLIILTMYSTLGGWSNVCLSIVIILPFYIVHPELFSAAVKMTLKLKWLFFSIFLVYYLLSPEISHLLIALLRISVLITIIFSVNLYLKTSTIEQILASLLWIFSPLKIFKINVERLSLRAVLTIEYIEILTQRIEKYKKKLSIGHNHTDKNGLKSLYLQSKERFLQVTKHFSRVLQDILMEISPENIKMQATKEYIIDCMDAPNGVQLLIPPILCLLYIYNPFSMVNF